MQTAAGAPRILAESAVELPADSTAVTLARVRARYHLTVLQYRGSIPAATGVASRLVENAVRHGIPAPPPPAGHIKLRLATTEGAGLVIEVEDLMPAFPRFDAAVRGEHGRGLQEAAQLGATITWTLHHEAQTKTVRAELPARPAPARPHEPQAEGDR
ncbi:ATP-binding protein [Streptomyces vinaceus]